MAAVPFVLEGFEPIERIGGGGFGEVWLARQSNIDRRVAIKVGHAPIDDKTVQLRFERECIALGRLSGHPNIVDVFTAGRMVDGRPYLVLEYVSGGTLWQRLQAQPLTEAQVIKVGTELAAALTVAHASGVLHRDLKPENVLLRPNGEAVLGDFGIARLHDGANTTSHAITASVAYAPPEILSGGSASVASDLYGIGICLLSCVIRSVPFVAGTDESIHPIINRVLTDKPPDLQPHGVSPGLNDLLQRLLAKDPAKRPPSAEQVRLELERLARGEVGTAGPVAGVAVADPGATRAVSYASTGSAPIGAASPAPATALGPAMAPPLQPAAYAPPSAAPPGATGGPFAPFQSQPYSRQPSPPPSPPGASLRSDRIRLFGAAFGATLLIGGLLIFVIVKLAGSSTGGGTDDTTGAPTVTADPTAATVGAPAAATTPVGATPTTLPLTLPLTLADLGLDPDSTVQADLAGPASPQYCENVPATYGLDNWTGQTVAEPVGSSVFQQLARFASADQARAYLNSYVATVNCQEWVIPESGDNPAITLRPSVATPTATYGDDTRALLFEGRSSFVTLYGRVTLVQRQAEVYLVSITSLTEDDLADLDRLVELAVDKLGY